jgi:hypothetical protein
VGFHSVFVHSAFVAFVFIRSALVVSVAPVTHPASSGSQTWWQVLWWGVRCFVHFVHSAPVLFVTWCSFVYPPLPSPSRDVAVSTRDPPCKQWLAGLGAGAGLSFIMWHSFVYPPLPSPSCDVAVSTWNPPCKQWLAGLGAGAGLRGVRSCILPSPHRHVTWPLAPTT